MASSDLFSFSSWPLVLAIAGVFLAAGVVKGVVGLGLPTVAMALLALLMPPAQAAALLIVPSLATNLWQMCPVATLPGVLRRIGGMQVGVCVGTLGGAWMLGAPAGAWATVSLGAALIAYALWGLSGASIRVPARAEWVWGPLVGMLTGLVTAATGVFAVPAVPYLQALGLPREALIQAMGVSFTVSTLALAAGLMMNGSYDIASAGASFWMLAPALLGMALGQGLRKTMSPQVFRRVFLGSLLLLGGYLIATA
ncbi:sulfite exporter TauE/SafE family protein [Schauerella aestuarii]|uniref:sulfite exporter TauE/SafE family protein n=1 Tax=Schauerella aestuarii TaxID=2511204 RepID=UPI00136B66DD|nr:sulfite exporter TauE/SafE family protein [Achromobacter aestuarii]MYZ44400.1 sulfite exporter TauE/SafE family protein [Achromobacter aestuarii]